MPDYATMPHFINRSELLEVDCQTKVVDALRELSSCPRSAVIIYETGRPTRYVNGVKLADAYLTAAETDKHVYDLDLLTFLDSPRAESKSLPQVGMSPVIADVIKPASGPLTKLGSAEIDRGVFRVVAAGNIIGYLFSHETFKTEADTPPPQFICTGPAQHTNLDPDSGSCYRCPYPIAKPS